MMNRSSIIKSLFTIVLMFGVFTTYSDQRNRCGVCNHRLSETYWTYNNTVCCSQDCVDALKPVCSRCGQIIGEKYLEAEGRKFCSSSCFEHTLPKCEICKSAIHSGYSITRRNYCEDCLEKSPTCFSCGFPAAYPSELSDGRITCNACRRWAVSDMDSALQHFETARLQLEAWTRLKFSTVPALELVDRTMMEERSGSIRKSDSPLPVRGLYSRQTYMRKHGIFGAWKHNPENDRETIYLIDHLHDEAFRIAATHELMHDLVHEHFPRLEDAPLWVHEGICQFAAAQYCLRRNYRDALEGIETCSDPDYGDGYRYINNLAGFDGWHALRRWMESVDVASLPKTAPR